MANSTLTAPKYDFDFIVIGSGFGGSVAAHRLTKKGYKVGVLEMGKRYGQQDFPKTNWNVKKYLWVPQWGLHGFFRMSLFQHAWILSGVGVGGGSLTYANVLLEPPDTIWDDPQWVHLEDWSRLMPPFYETAKKMLGVTTNPYLGRADKFLQAAAEQQGYGHTFYPSPVGVYFGEPGHTAPDPYFGGAGPDRTGCVLCGGCMIGCRYGAKNTLDKNYLYFAEKNGAQIIPETMATAVKPLDGQADGSQGYEIETISSTRLFFKQKRVYRARGVVFSAGVLGTVKLLLKLRENGSLPRLSRQIGNYARTNAEAIIGVRLQAKQADVTDGVAIGSGIYLDEQTHVEAFHYAKDADALAPLTTLLASGQPGPRRILAWLATLGKHPFKFIKACNPFGFAQTLIGLLVMQKLDSHLQMRLRRSLWPPFGQKLVTAGPRIPATIPRANRFAEEMGRQLGGIPVTALTEILFNAPTTAHILGGAVMGANPQEGVIDSQGRVFNYKNMYICDGSMIGANLGVNPALTITALAEYIMAQIKPAAEDRPDKPERTAGWQQSSYRG